MKNLLLPLQAYLLGRTGSRLIGLVLLVSLIWWVGPYVGLADETLRLGLIAGLLVLVMLALLLRRLWVWRRAGRFHGELRGRQDGADRDLDLEVSQLREKMDAAIATLKSSELGVGYRGSSALYALPWFMLIGPSAAGKTTLLRHSGLHFPYADQGEMDIRGFGGTRNCDWWFSNEAVLLDTAGRYTTEPADHQEWKAFLALLRKHRQRLPINGVLVAMSLEELLTIDQAGLARHVKIIRDRIDELITDLGCLVPVYLILTKCDLLHGFNAFFEDLGEHDRNQVWGAWLAENPTGDGENPSSLLEGRLKDLHQRLCAMRLRKLAMQRRFVAKGRIHEFPAEFQTAAARLTEFTRLLFKPNPYQETPRFCGVYLTSAIQEGTPLQRILGNLRQAFGYVEEQAPQGQTTRSYFIKKVFQDVIFPNAQAGFKSRRREVLTRWLKSGWVAASLALITGTFMVLSTSLAGNSLILQQGAAATGKVRSVLSAAAPEPAGFHAALEELHAHYRALLANERRLPWHLWLGAYHGGEQLAPSREMLLDVLDLSFFQTVTRSLEVRLENQVRQWQASGEPGREALREAFYEDLRLYLMLGRPQHLDVASVLPRLCELWHAALSRDDRSGDFRRIEASDLEELVAFYLEQFRSGAVRSDAAAWSPRTDLVAQARDQLRASPNAARLYAQILGKARSELKDRSLDDLLRGFDFGTLSSRVSLPGPFTERGWREQIQPEIKRAVSAACRGDWVLDPGAEIGEAQSIDMGLAERLEREIRALYFAEYSQAWYRLLESVRVAPFTSLDDAARKFQTLGRSDGPLAELLRVVSHNINLEEEAMTSGAAMDALGIPGAPRHPVPELESTFRDLRRLCNPAEQMSVSLLLNQYLQGIAAVQGEIERLNAAGDVARETGRYAANLLNGGGGSELYKSWVSTSSLLSGVDARTRAVVAQMLMAPLRQTWQLILTETRKDLQTSWKNQVLSAYERTIQGRFPFAETGRDAALVDVVDFFRPDDGLLWSFVGKDLTPFLSAERGGWRQKTWLDQGLGFSEDLLAALEQARLISAGLFRRGGAEPDVQFYLYPLPSRGLSEMYLESNGQHYRYRNEPQEWRQFRWPGDLERLGARIHGINGVGNERAELGYEGVWGLFHLLKRAELTAENNTQYLGAWELDDSQGVPVKVLFRLRADRENNVFEPGLFSRLKLPEAIF
ncbi:type VI secretion system membrane subunit TssM [Geoalkalibacter sp.]|uniref:type VI secretion system membrane subunit TssM n=1 Tax=Geoalkalibacter sp. TaxID=3041440 RepID=UPI00272E27B3|nr:type VI secretion system membrane subunit TssM [Geoalkalibacter sp.]